MVNTEMLRAFFVVVAILGLLAAAIASHASVVKFDQKACTTSEGLTMCIIPDCTSVPNRMGLDLVVVGGYVVLRKDVPACNR